MTRDGFYDYTARYTPGATAFHCPARVTPDVEERLAETAVAAHRLLGLRDISRMDAVVDREGRVRFPVAVELTDGEGVLVAEMTVQWYVRKRE